MDLMGRFEFEGKNLDKKRNLMEKSYPSHQGVSQLFFWILNRYLYIHNFDK